MNTFILSPGDAQFWGATHKVVVTAADIAALSADSAALAVLPMSGTIPAKTRVSLAAAVLNTAFDFSDTSINSMALIVGDGGDTDRFLTTTETAVDGTEILYKAPAVATNEYIYLAADTVDITVTVTGGASPTLAECNAGQLTLYFNVQNLDDLLRA